MAARTFDGIGRIKSLTQSPSDHTDNNQDHLLETLEGLRSIRYRSLEKPPWLDGDGNVIWSPLRIRVANFVLSQSFETVMGMIIVGNICLIVFEANQDARCIPEYVDRGRECPYGTESIEWLFWTNLTLLLVYSVECCIRWYVERTGFFCNKWNMIDLVTVLLGWVSMVLASVVNLSILRLSRLIRVLRAIRVFISIPEFYLLVTGLYSSIKAIFFGAMMLLFVIVFWAIVAVEILHPVMARMDWQRLYCPDCMYRFSDVFSAGVTLFQQIVAGDSWGELSLPLIAENPWISVMLFAIMMTISLGVMNLILAVIVERATEARENDQEQRIKKKEEERAKNMVELAVLCANLDKDESGTVSLEEMQEGYDSDKNFKMLMDQMDIKRDEMEVIFHVLDSDNSGNLSYLEFCKNLGSFFKRDPIIMHSLVQCTVLDVKKLIQKEVVSVMREQHAEMMREQRKLLAAFGLLAGSEPRDVPVPAPKLPEIALRSRAPLETMERIQAELEPLMAKIERIAEVLDAPSAEQGRPEDRPGLSLEALVREEQGNEVKEDDSSTAPRRRSDPEVEVQYAVMCDSFQRRADEAERLQRRLYNAIQYLSVLRGFDKVDPSHAKYYEV
ncbi:Scn8a [Symbiodinium sp. KB8]|nr:Scn8a [Symbiodinium sp. KB8]